MIAAQAVQDIFRRALHIVAMIEGKVPPGGEDFFVQAFPVHQRPQGIGDVLRMQVVGARDGLAQPLADFNHAVLNHKRLFQVDDIGPPGGLFHQGQVALGKDIALGPDDGLDDGKLVVLQRVIRLHGRVFVVGPGHNPDLMSGLSKVFHRAAGRCGQSVACGEKVV